MSLEKTWASASTMCPAWSTSHSGISDKSSSLPTFPTTRAFVFRPEYQRVAQLVLSAAKRDFIEKEKAKKRKKKANRKPGVTFVGIHNRRGDHIQYQKEVGFTVVCMDVCLVCCMVSVY